MGWLFRLGFGLGLSQRLHIPNNSYQTYPMLNSIPEEDRPSRDQPNYHLFAENLETSYIAYVSEQNLLLANPASQYHIRRWATYFLMKSKKATILGATPKLSI
jgi:hemimethylated DNA binding protein